MYSPKKNQPVLSHYSKDWAIQVRSGSGEVSVENPCIRLTHAHMPQCSPLLWTPPVHNSVLCISYLLPATHLRMLATVSTALLSLSLSRQSAFKSRSSCSLEARRADRLSARCLRGCGEERGRERDREE